MDFETQLFWIRQQGYILKIFLPIVVGFLILSVGLLSLFILNFWNRHYRLWRLGKEEDRSGELGKRIKTLLAVIFAHFRLWEEPYPGTMHFLIFWGVLLIFLGKIARIFSLPIGLTNPPQPIFLYSSLISEIGGVWVILGGSMAVFRRYILKPSRLDTKPERTLIFIWGFLLLLTGYFIKGYRIAAAGINIPTNWLVWAPISYPLSKYFL
ncbi:MAG: hypothetical protein ACPL6D_14680, partial [Thermodesulfobacteriota bacterium]